MIETLRGLAIAGALTVALAIVAIVDSSAVATGEVDRAIVPGFAAAGVTALAWPETDVKIVRDAKSSTGWRWENPVGEAEPRVVEDVLSTLRGARWHREADASTAGATVAKLVVEPGPTIHVGERFGEAQQWIVVGDRALLVDADVARSLVPEPLALRIRAPLARAPDAKQIEIDGMALHGSPRRLVRDAVILVDPRIAAELERALADLTVVAIPTTPVRAAGRKIVLEGVVAVQLAAGSCANGTRPIVGARTGAGCVTDSAWRVIDDAVAPLTTDFLRIVEARPAPIQPIRMTLPDATVIELERRQKIQDRDVDPAAVLELFAVLNTPAEPVAHPHTKPVGQIVVAGRDITVTVELFAGNVVARAGEPVALQLGEAAYKLLVRPGRAYLDPTLWAEEATTIRSLTINNVTYTRGAALGEWSGPIADAATVDQLVQLLATPRSLGDAPATPATHRLELTIVPPAGTSSKRSLTIGANCVAAIESQHLRLDPRICDLVVRLARANK